MPELASRSWSWLVSAAEPSARNLVTLVGCLALYSVFLSRGVDRSHKRTSRPGRSPDSVLRGGGH